MLIDFRETVLDNGVKVLTSSLPHVESVAVGIWVGVGARYESKKVAGVSHFIEHLLFKGTKKRTAQEISQEIEGCGGYLNAFTQEENTCYYARVAYDQALNAVDVLCDMYQNSRFNKVEVDKERGVIIEETMMYRDQPHHIAQESLTAALWQGHPLGVPIIGYPETISSISRADIVSFKESRYVPENTLFVFAGKVDHDLCVKKVSRVMGRAKRRRKPSFRPVAPTTKQTGFVARQKDIEQSHLALGFRIFGRDSKRRYSLKVMNTILGENMSSRLFQVVREKHGLAYSIHSHGSLYSDTGALTISAGLDRSADTKALSLILRELKRLRDKRVSQAELTRAKDYIIGQLRLGLESTTNQMMWLGDNMMAYSKVIFPEETIASISSVTAADVQSVSQSVFRKSKASLAIVSPDPHGKSEDRMKSAISRL